MIRAPRFKRAVTATAALVLGAAPALAHPGHTALAGFAAGFMHPLSGLDHIVTMLAIGALAAQSKDRLRMAILPLFVAGMLGGGTLGMAGFSLPHAESAISVLCVLLAFLVLTRPALGRWTLMPAAIAIAGLHGLVHGGELGAIARPIEVSAGFASATLLLLTLGYLACHAAGLSPSRNEAKART